MVLGTRAMLRYIDAHDRSLMHRLNGWQPPMWVRAWMLAATHAGDGWLWYSLGIAILLFGGQQRFMAASAAAIAGAGAVGLFSILKPMTGRKRPCAIAPNSWASLLPPDQFSFPSGHTMTAFAVTTPLYLFYPPLLPLLLFAALSVAASRILLGMHFLSDVLAGSLLGAVLGILAYGVFA
jgi:undecaprenyl-diphosphatase